MAYDYIRRAYGVDLKVGERVRHTVTGRDGRIIRTNGDPQYFRVRFDDFRTPRNAHPKELTQLGAAPGQEPPK